MEITLKKGDLIRFVSVHADKSYLFIYLFHYKNNDNFGTDYMRILNIQKSCRIESHMIRKGDFGSPASRHRYSVRQRRYGGWEKVNQEEE